MAALPELDAAAAAHAARVARALHDAIDAAGGALPFDAYMELALYAPGLGYYAAGAHKLGAGGDFVTAPELTPLFGRALARQLAPSLQGSASEDAPVLLELGPGSGALACDLLLELDALGAAPARYLLLETSPELRERQRARIARLPPALAARAAWLDALPVAPLRGAIIANEVLDALPCERFVQRDGGTQELAVVRDGAGLTLIERAARPTLADAVHALERARGARFADGYQHELRTRLPPFVATLAGRLAQGQLLFIDYGLDRRALYASERSMGTFRAFHRQRALDDALFRPGLCDLTAWVDFTAVAEAATGAGLELAGYTSQAQFLLGCGIAELAAAEGPEALALARASSAVQKLTLPAEMGESFKAIGFTRGAVAALPGFSLRDLAHLL
jgi:SAM-dependent MidA family methyltransferase